MKTLTVRLPEVLVAQIEAESRDRKVSKSDVVRERLSLAAGLKSPGPPSFEAIADLIGSVDGLTEDLGARKKHYLKVPAMVASVLADAASWSHYSAGVSGITIGPLRRPGNFHRPGERAKRHYRKRSTFSGSQPRRPLTAYFVGEPSSLHFVSTTALRRFSGLWKSTPTCQ